MKKLKDVVAISLVFAMAFSLIGCGKAREKADEDDETEVDEEYMKTANTLKSICDNTPYIQYLYVV